MCSPSQLITRKLIFLLSSAKAWVKVILWLLESSKISNRELLSWSKTDKWYLYVWNSSITLPKYSSLLLSKENT